MAAASGESGGGASGAAVSGTRYAGGIYTQAEVIQFANDMHADLVLGVQIDKTQGAAGNYDSAVQHSLFYTGLQ